MSLLWLEALQLKDEIKEKLHVIHTKSQYNKLSQKNSFKNKSKNWCILNKNYNKSNPKIIVSCDKLRTEKI